MAQFDFTAESDKNAPTRSAIVETINVPFVFGRLGLFYSPKLASNGGTYPYLGCKVPNFEYENVPLKDGGYLYIYFEKKNGQVLPQGNSHLEYKISIGKTLPNGYRGRDEYLKIDWKEEDLNGDTHRREASSQRTQIINFEATDIVWIAFSQIQISSKRLREIYSDAKQLKARFQKLDVDYWLKHYPYKNFEQIKKDKYFKTLLSTDTEDRKASAYYSVDNISNKTVYCFALNDALNAAGDVYETLCDAYLDLQSLITSLGTPFSQEQVKQKLESIDGSLTNTNKATMMVENEQFSSLFQSAILLNNLFFSKEAQKNKKLDEYRALINKERIDGILAKFEIEDLGAKIYGSKKQSLPTKFDHGLRESLGVILQSSYYNDILSDAFYTGNEGIAYYKNVSMKFLAALARLPQPMYSFMGIDIDSNTIEANDKWIQYVLSTFSSAIVSHGQKQIQYKSNLNIAQQLLEVRIDIPWIDSKGIVLDTKVWIDQNYGVIYNIISSVETASTIFLNTNLPMARFLETNAKLLSELESAIAKVGKLEIQNSKAEEFSKNSLKASQTGIYPIGSLMSPGGKVPEYVVKNAKAYASLCQAEAAKLAQIGKLGHFGIKVYTTLKKSAAVEKILDLALLQKAMLVLSGMNFIKVALDFREYSFLNFSGKQFGNVSGVVAFYTALPSLQSRYMALTRIVAVKLEKKMSLQSGSITRYISSRFYISSIASIAFIGITTYFSITEAIMLGKRGNTEEASWALASAISSTILGFLFIISCFVGGPVWIGLIQLLMILFTVLGIGSGILSAIKSKNYMEMYLESIVFYSQNKPKIWGKDSYELRHKLCEPQNCKELTGEYAKKENNWIEKREKKISPIPMSNYNNMLQWLFNLCIHWSVNNKFRYIDKRKYITSHFDGLEYGYPDSISFDIQFSYFPPQSMLVAHLCFYPMGADQDIVISLLKENSYLPPLTIDKYKQNFIIEVGDLIRRLHRGEVYRDELEVEDKQRNVKIKTIMPINPKVACYILYLQIKPMSEEVSGGTFFPFRDEGKDVYIAISETVLAPKGYIYGAHAKYDVGMANRKETTRTAYYIDDSGVYEGEIRDIRAHVSSLYTVELK